MSCTNILTHNKRPVIRNPNFKFVLLGQRWITEVKNAAVYMVCVCEEKNLLKSIVFGKVVMALHVDFNFEKFLYPQTVLHIALAVSSVHLLDTSDTFLTWQKP